MHSLLGARRLRRFYTVTICKIPPAVTPTRATRQSTHPSGMGDASIAANVGGTITTSTPARCSIALSAANDRAHSARTQPPGAAAQMSCHRAGGGGGLQTAQSSQEPFANRP